MRTLQNPHFEQLFPLVAALFIASLLPLALIRFDRSMLAKARRVWWPAGRSPASPGY